MDNTEQAVLRVVAGSAQRGDLVCAVAVTARESESASVLAVIAGELRALRCDLDCLTLRVNANSDNIDAIASALRAACDELESISGTEPDDE